VDDKSRRTLVRFGDFELDLQAGQLLRNSRLVRLQPQPFTLLCLLVSQPGRLFTREEIKAALWQHDTFVDFEQGVNFAVKQVREALGDHADSAVYIQTELKRGYRFLAPVTEVAGGTPQASASKGQGTADPELEKALWANITELRLADDRRRKYQLWLVAALVLVALAVASMVLARW
jgi:DNA-binding winged helix-turn-helix (wHTH) protein